MMSTTDQTPRYRNFSTNMPLSTNTTTPRAPSTLITVEKEPERDPEVDCFMCRQSHVYVKPIGMHQERRVARRHPPPLTRAQIDALSRKKHLTKQEVRKLLQCYFPEIKDVKYFQLHKYHSCCYDPKHLNLCKNHITAFQHERHQHTSLPEQEHDENPYKEFERDGNKPNRVSFVRIKIEPTKGIPTRFLGPTALPESLADMLLQQVNRVEEKKPTPSFNTNNTTQSYKIRRINQRHNDDDEDEDEDGEEQEDDDEEDDDDDENESDEANQGTHVTGKKSKKTKGKISTGTGDIVVEDIEDLNRLNLNQQTSFKRKKRKKTTKKKLDHDKSKLKHWELMALDQAQQEPCNCRHHVMRVEGDQVVYDWCRCKDNQHKEIIERGKPLTVVPPPSPPPPQQPKREIPPSPPTPPPPPQPKTPKPKQKKIRQKSIGIDATGPPTTELALAYDPSAVDYDMIQETIYYRTSSGRLIKPEITNAFTYDTMPPAITTMTLDPNAPVSNKAEVLYMAPNGQIQPYESGGPLSNRTRITNRSLQEPKSLVLSNPGSFYNGHARVDTNHSTPTNRGSAAMPVLRLPPSVSSSHRTHSHENNHNVTNTNNNDYQPAEFTLATFTPDKNINTPASQRSLASGSQRSTTSDSHAPSRNVSVSKQRSTKPTYSNLEPTPDYGRESSVIANRRWFDQPLGDQNLRPVHDGQYGLIAGATTGQQAATNKTSVPEYNHYMDTHSPKNDSNCTIS